MLPYRLDASAQVGKVVRVDSIQVRGKVSDKVLLANVQSSAPSRAMTNSNPSANRKLRWGILGAAEIARKNFKAICNSGNSIVSGVASRDLERCQKFISACQA